MLDFEPIVYPPDDPTYQMANSLISLLDERSRSLAQPPAIRLIARSPVSPVSKMIWSHLGSLHALGADVQVVFHKRQHQGTARRAAQMYRDVFGDCVFENIRLADYKEVGSLYEELQMGTSIAWSGSRMSGDGSEMREGDVSRSIGAGQLAMFQSTWNELYEASESFALAVGMRDSRSPRGFTRLLRAAS